MFLAKSAIPCRDSVFFKITAVQKVAEYPFTYIAAPPGYLVPGHLSSVLGEEGHPIFWLSTGPEDRDPATLLLSLISTGKSVEQHLGEETINEMQRHPGCVYGWGAHYKRLSAEFTHGLPCTFAFVLENIHQLGENSPALKLARSLFLNQLQPSTNRILISHTEFFPGVIKSSGNVIGVDDLQLHPHDRLFQDGGEGIQLTKEDAVRILQLGRGRPDVLSGILSTCEQGAEYNLHKILQESKTLHQLLVQVGQSCLDMADSQELQALALALTLGYFHEETFEEITGKTILPRGPWLQFLSTGWTRIHELWRPALESILHRYMERQEEVVCLAADKLTRLGAVEIAIPLYLRIRRYEKAGIVIQSQLGNLMNFGQWQTLDGWIRQLPVDVTLGSPEILYAQGEMQAFYGQQEKAKSAFVQAGNIFSHRGDPINTCRSLLAESTLAARRGDRKGAFTSAHAAQTISSTSSGAMNQERAWSDWQCGVLVSMDGKSDYAKIQFQDACQLTRDPYTKEVFQQALIYTQEMDQVDLQLEHHRHEAQMAEQTRQEVLRHLLDLFKTSPACLPDLLKHYGWLAVPLIFKLPVQTPQEAVPETDPLDRLVHRFKTKVKVAFHWGKASNIPTSPSPLSLLAPFHFSIPDYDRVLGSNPPFPEKTVSQPAEETPKVNPGIMIYCLGPLRVLNNGQFVTSWPSHKAQLVFKYLLIHHNTLVHKETIMDVFWPDADVEAARRNLHQAIYNLRLSLRDIEDDQQIIEFVQDGYRINPSLPIWIDYTEFEQHYKTARQSEQAGFLDQAMSDYSLVEEMYMDHLFSEDLYEDWIRSQREYLWQIYLSAATRLAEYQFQKRNYSSAISIGQRILQKDPCEEIAHQILMRCFHRQGQRQLAIRQYEICRQALREELDVEPSNATRQFFSKILSE
jgi:DNA-binding SARP family transcriptional activator